MISVIVPVYNVEKYLRKSLDSILAQTYTDLEVLLVDDGSTDNCLSICQEYAKKDSRIILLTKENGGQGSARNMALDRMRGDYVSFVDPDDYILPTMLQEMVENIESYDADLAICYMNTIDTRGRVKQKASNKPKFYNNKELMREYATTGEIGEGPCNKLYKSKLFSQIRFPEIIASEDIYIMHEILGMCEGAVHLGKAYYVQTIRGDSTEHKPFSELNLVLLECADRVNEYYEKNYPEFLELVAFKKIYSIAKLMRRILVSGDYWKYRKVYKKLKLDLTKEYQTKLALYPEAPGVSKRTREAILHPVRFKIIGMLYGIKRKLFN